MSKFIDRLEEIIEGAPARMGFGPARAEKTPGLALIVQVSSSHQAGAATATGPDEVRTFLAQLLPPYMIPSALVSVDEIPMTPIGKVDREALLQSFTFQGQGEFEAHVGLPIVVQLGRHPDEGPLRE